MPTFSIFGVTPMLVWIAKTHSLRGSGNMIQLHIDTEIALQVIINNGLSVFKFKKQKRKTLY